MNPTNKLIISEPVKGFTERDSLSKAILNTDVDSLLKYKIQKRKLIDINKNSSEIDAVKSEIKQIKCDLTEIKTLLLKITREREYP
jgi:hypothetical protein